MLCINCQSDFQFLIQVTVFDTTFSIISVLAIEDSLALYPAILCRQGSSAPVGVSSVGPSSQHATPRL